ncbi:MAG: hypothetical protein PHF37_05770 [Phycisphaerae bacterium]|nr:hypothetical protein [Phycisphaerae bacterium]
MTCVWSVAFWSVVAILAFMGIIILACIWYLFRCYLNGTFPKGDLSGRKEK